MKTARGTEAWSAETRPALDRTSLSHRGARPSAPQNANQLAGIGWGNKGTAKAQETAATGRAAASRRGHPEDAAPTPATWTALKGRAHRQRRVQKATRVRSTYQQRPESTADRWPPGRAWAGVFRGDDSAMGLDSRDGCTALNAPNTTDLYTYQSELRGG